VTAAPLVLIFDSGLGGLTVAHEVIRGRPDASYVYVADDAFFPYGDHGEKELVARVVPLMGNLIAEHRPDAVVIACNTASTLVLAPLREAYDMPFVGTVPAIKPACTLSRTKRVSVLGTSGTVKREYTQSLIRDFAKDCEVTLVGSAKLAQLAEAALNGEVVRDADITAEIMPCFVDDDRARTDIVVLACTHYPLLLKRMKSLAPWPVEWIDPAPAIAKRTSTLLGPPREGARPVPTRVAFTSGRQPSERLARALPDFLGESVLA
jgi:glutamate racemase